MDIKRIDNSYKPFPSFSDWAKTNVNNNRWKKYASKIDETSKNSPKTLERALKIVQRVAAVETGAVEDLYKVDRGFTLTVAMESAMWESALSEKNNETKLLIKSQLQAYDYIIDFATGAEPIAQVWIRQLHEKLCAGQKTYLVQTSAGPQEQELPLGKYKKLPNHVMGEDGNIHAYAPVDLTPSEMQRLIDEIRSDEFLTAHPSLQASYVHYAFVTIHPFSDGNGRVARALASVFTYRSNSIPYLVQSDDRIEYFDSLAEADKGDFQSFIDFTIDRCLDAMELVVQSMLAAKTTSAVVKLSELDNFYRTKGGYSYEEVDTAGKKLIKQIHDQFQKQLTPLKEIEYIENATANLSNAKFNVIKENYRLYTNSNGQIVRTNLTTKQPNQKNVRSVYHIEIPVDCGATDDFAIIKNNEVEVFAARMNELNPNIRSSLSLRIEIFCEAQVNELAESLFNTMRDSSRKSL